MSTRELREHEFNSMGEPRGRASFAMADVPSGLSDPVFKRHEINLISQEGS